jgi:hypothetical protein
LLLRRSHIIDTTVLLAVNLSQIQTPVYTHVLHCNKC